MLTITELCDPSYPVIRSSEQNLSNETTINHLSKDMILVIFQNLDLTNYLSVSRVCHQWKRLVNDSSSAYRQHLKIKNLSSNVPNFSAWESMPRHWGLHNDRNVLKFSSLSPEGTITFHPPFCTQSSKFFSFTSKIELSDRYIFLNRHSNTYFLTPQGQTQLKLDLPTDLEPLASHELVVVNMDNPEKKIQFSLLQDLPYTNENLLRTQIEHCFPITEKSVVIVTSSGEISFWDLSGDVPKCDKKLEVNHIPREAYKLGNHLILDLDSVNLSDLSVRAHSFDFTCADIRTFESTLCAYNDSEQEVNYFIINEHEVLEKAWSLTLDSLPNYIDQSYGPLISSNVCDLNKDFILLSCWQSSLLNLLILNTKGELVHSVREELSEHVENYSIYMYPHCAHLSDDILIYKKPQGLEIAFWHIPSKKQIIDFMWTRSIYDLPVSLGKARVQDVRYFDGKLTILLSHGHISTSNKPCKYRLIQFDSKTQNETGIMGGLVSKLKAIYFAFPGKSEF